MRFEKDGILSGFIISFLSVLAGAFVILLIQKLFHIDIMLNMKMYIFSALPGIFLLRRYAKSEKYSALKGSVLALVITLGCIIAVLMKYNYMEL
ncbi:MAG: hypothetical protein IJ681_05440 [Bacteroidales bacterium]|nr:hypothetical protein [Bacteroidales bacterium]